VRFAESCESHAAKASVLQCTGHMRDVANRSPYISATGEAEALGTNTVLAAGNEIIMSGSIRVNESFLGYCQTGTPF
jgi:hypothetical protein